MLNIFLFIGCDIDYNNILHTILYRLWNKKVWKHIRVSHLKKFCSTHWQDSLSWETFKVETLVIIQTSEEVRINGVKSWHYLRPNFIISHYYIHPRWPKKMISILN